VDTRCNTDTYIDQLIDRLAGSGTRAVLRYRGRDSSAREFLESVFRYARALARLGVGRGGLIALLAPNCPDALAVRYASNLLGAGAMFLSLPGSSQRRAELVAEVDPTLLVIFSNVGRVRGSKTGTWLPGAQWVVHTTRRR
jgi:fatty-acyl-CoA synthase